MHGMLTIDLHLEVQLVKQLVLIVLVIELWSRHLVRAAFETTISQARVVCYLQCCCALA